MDTKLLLARLSTVLPSLCHSSYEHVKQREDRPSSKVYSLEVDCLVYFSRTIIREMKVKGTVLSSELQYDGPPKCLTREPIHDHDHMLRATSNIYLILFFILLISCHNQHCGLENM